MGEVVTIRRSDPIVCGPSRAITIVPAAPIRIGPAPVPATIQAAPVARVIPPPRGAWDEKGWEKGARDGEVVYTGFYQALDRRRHEATPFPGSITVEGDRISAFIRNPPQEIRGHPKGPCFMRWDGDWFLVNWQRPPGNVDDAILYVEKILDQAINRRG